MADEPKPPQQPIDFYTFALSLGSSAFIHLGDAPHPETAQFEVNLLLAKQTIDLLGMLEQKTKGNLTPDEAKLLDNLLYDLRLRYVTKQREKAGGAPPEEPAAETDEDTP